MRHYLQTWRANRRLQRSVCECGNAPRVDYDKGCARCEAMDRARYKGERVVDVVRRHMARFDLVSVGELAEVCVATEAQMRHALRALIAGGEVEVVGASTATEYRMKQRRAA